MKIAQEQLGHASIATTLNIYTHVVDASHRKAIEVVVVGALSTAGGVVVLEVSGSRERFTLQPGSGQQLQRYDDLRARSKAGPSGPLALTGSVDITDPTSMKMIVTAVAQP